MRDGIKIIDGHIHTFSSLDASRKIQNSFNRIYSIEFELSGSGTIENTIDVMKKAGTDISIMANFAPPARLHKNNIWSLKEASKTDKLWSLVSFHPEMGFEFEVCMKEYIEKGAKGVKLHPMAQNLNPNTSEMDKLYDLCCEYDIPVVFHCGRVSNARTNEFSDLEYIEPIIKRHSELKVILTHMADGDYDAVLRTAREYENVFFDTSIVITGSASLKRVNKPSWCEDEKVKKLISEIGSDRILFGSDFPWGSPCDDVERFINMGLDRKDLEAIMSKNAMKVFDRKKSFVSSVL